MFPCEDHQFLFPVFKDGIDAFILNNRTCMYMDRWPTRFPRTLPPSSRRRKHMDAARGPYVSVMAAAATAVAMAGWGRAPGAGSGGPWRSHPSSWFVATRSDRCASAGGCLADRSVRGASGPLSGPPLTVPFRRPRRHLLGGLSWLKSPQPFVRPVRRWFPPASG